MSSRFKKRKGTDLADTGLILAFIGVVAITCYQIGGKELRGFFNSFTNVQSKITDYSTQCANSTDPDCT